MSDRPHDINDLLKDLNEQIDWYIGRIVSLTAACEQKDIFAEGLQRRTEELNNVMVAASSRIAELERAWDDIPWEEIEAFSKEFDWYKGESKGMELLRRILALRLCGADCQGCCGPESGCYIKEGRE